MAYEFTQNLLTGNAVIDEQHRKLFVAINDLLSNCSSGKAKEEVYKTVDYLYDYTARHFNDEEQLQKNSNYPDYLRHKQYHDTFKKMVSDLKQDEKASGLALVVKVNGAAGWLISHIQTQDVKVAEHLRNQKG